MKATVLILFLCFFAFADLQPVPKTQWWKVNINTACSTLFHWPSVASFNNGDFVVVYPTNDTTIYDVKATIYTSSGAVKVREFGLVTLVELQGPWNGVKVVVLPDNTAVAVFRSSSQTDYPFYATLFDSNGTILQGTTALLATSNSETTVNGPIEILSTGVDNGFAVSYPTFSLVIPNLLLFPSKDLNVVSQYRFDSTSVSRGAIIDNKMIYMSLIADPTIMCSTFNTSALSLLYPFTTWNLTYSFTNVVPFSVQNQSIIPYLFTTKSGSLRMSVISNPPVTQGPYVRVISLNSTSDFAPSVMSLGGDMALVAYHASTGKVKFQQVKVVDAYSTPTLVGPSAGYGASNYSSGVSMARISASDLIVVAKELSTGNVIARIFTFCGNQLLDMAEQCDGTPYCLNDCTCDQRTVPVNGRCVPMCGDGVVMDPEECDGGEGCNGCKCTDGYQPTLPRQSSCQPIPSDYVPSVGPTLDCLQDSNGVISLYFSFINNEGYDLTIPYGYLNEFFPTDYATDRPTFFPTGSSLTYPMSPYKLDINDGSTFLVKWLLGSYNLTVDYSNTSAFLCPENPGFSIVVTTFGELTTDMVQIILNNFAAEYNVSLSRLTATYRLESAGTTTEPNVYVVSIKILPRTSVDESTSEEILKNFFEDIKNNKELTEANLTNGLDEVAPKVEDVAPLPTGVETRGQPRPVVPPVSFPPNTGARTTFWPIVFLVVLVSTSII